jgi:hypothetical protein
MHLNAPAYTMPMFNSTSAHMGGPTPVSHTFNHNLPWPQPPETCLPHLAFAYPPPMTPYQAHTDLHVASTPQAIVSPNQPTTIQPTTVYLKEDSTLKLPTCPEDPKDFPAYEKKVRASLPKLNMHHLLDNGTMTTEANCEFSAKIASALMLSFKTKHIKWFMGTSEYAKTPCLSEILNFFLIIMCFFS